MRDMTPMEFAHWLNDNRVESAASLPGCDGFYTRTHAVRAIFPKDSTERIRYILAEREVMTAPPHGNTTIPPDAVREVSDGKTRATQE